MLRKIIFVGAVLFISACKPVADNGAIKNSSPSTLQCIESQSQCELNTELGNFSLKFSQQQLSDKIKTELPFFLELSYLKDSNEQSTPKTIK